MTLALLIAAFFVCDLLVVLCVLGMARCGARADARAQREAVAWVRDRAAGREATQYPGMRERPGPSGARAAGARPRLQR